MIELRHRQAIVTGAASGIGRATATLLSGLGATVIGLDLNELPDLAYGFVRVDLTNEQSVVEAVRDAAARLGRVTLLVNCAGIAFEAPLRDTACRGSRPHVRGQPPGQLHRSRARL